MALAGFKLGPMAHRIVLVFSLYVVLNGIEGKLTSVRECCEAGRQMALRKQDCTALQRFTSHICSIAQEHCCRSSSRKRACDIGIKMARGQGACERPFFTGSSWETQISQACCDCCTLGLKTNSMGFSCEFQDLELDTQCSNAAKVCCEKPKDTNPTAKEQPKVFTTRPPEEANTCRELNCTQLCVDNRCGCNDGFQLQRDGVTCRDINECLMDSHNCSAEQVCFNTEGSFYCQLRCHPGFMLTDNIICKDMDECALGSHDCGANYVCINTAGSFYCEPKVVCRDGYSKDAAGKCVDIDECLVLSNPCRPGQNCINTVGSYSCRRETVRCPLGFQPNADGTRCEDVDECLITNVCGNHVCVNLNGSYRCECSAGYRFNNVTEFCEDVNECKFYNWRLCGHICENTEGSYRCRCISGFRLAPDGRTCDDVNECLTGSHNCASGQVCINTEGSFHCRSKKPCSTGYKLTDNICQDIDECALGSHDCGAHYVCVNTAGSFYCDPKAECGDGYAKDAADSCVDIDECLAHTNPCQPGQTCINTVGSYSCHTNTVTCPRGFHLSVNGTQCEDVNECLIGNKCGSHTCVNLEGTYRCECRNGYMFNRVTKLCEDINECTHYPGRLCSHKCENTEGSYRCSCATGFKLAYDGRDCEDINECEGKPCSQECTNVYGSYQCYCHRGYQLNDVDGITCEDIDECVLPNVCSYQCLNTPGSFNCTCPASGYTLSYDGRTCQDIDECATGTHSCSARETCFNVQGGFRCLFFECPTNFRRAAKGSTDNASAVVRCVKSCQEHDGDCALDPVHIITSTALSLPTLQDLEEPEEIVLLRTSAEAKPDLLPDEPDVLFDLLATDELMSFDVIKRSQNGVIVGVIRQIKPVMGPKELVLEVTMKYFQSGVVSQKNIVLIHVFISKFWF